MVQTDLEGAGEDPVVRGKERARMVDDDRQAGPQSYNRRHALRLGSTLK
jgi:hypothetical protein